MNFETLAESILRNDDDKWILVTKFHPEVITHKKPTTFYTKKPLVDMPDEIRQLCREKAPPEEFSSNYVFSIDTPTGRIAKYSVGSKEFVDSKLTVAKWNNGRRISYVPELELDKDTENTFGDLIREL